MSSDPVQSRAAQIVDRILFLLDEQAIARAADLPVAQALDSFTLVWNPPFSVAQFHRVIGEFVAHVHACETSAARSTSVDRAKDEAIALLERGYRSADEPGYDGALLDVVYPPELFSEGIVTVLINLGEAMKAARRQQYIDWVYARHIDPFDHKLGRAIVAHILHWNRRVFPEDLRQCGEFELVDQIPFLIDSLRETGQVVEELLSDQFTSLT
jgi:hypothetical protein